MRALLAVLTALPASALQAQQFQQGLRVWDKSQAPTGAVSWMRKDFSYCRDDWYTPNFTYVSTDECKASCAASSSCYGFSVGTYNVAQVRRTNICFHCTNPYIVDVTNTSEKSLGAEDNSPWRTGSNGFTSYVKATPDPNWIVKDSSLCNGNKVDDWYKAGLNSPKSVAECKADCEASPDCYAIVVGDYTTIRHACMLCTEPKAADVSASQQSNSAPWSYSGWATALVKSQGQEEKSEKIGLDGWERKDWGYCYQGVDFAGRTQETLEECKASCSATPDCYAILIGSRQAQPRECFQCKDPMNGDAASSEPYWVVSGWSTAYIKAPTTIAPTPVPPTPAPPTTAPTPCTSGTCVVSEDPHVENFDGAQISLLGGSDSVLADEGPGAKWLVKSGRVNIQAMYMPERSMTGDSLFVRAVAVGGEFLKGNTLIIGSLEDPSTWNGGAILEDESSYFEVHGEGFSVRANRTSHSRLVQDLSKANSGVNIELPAEVRLTVNRLPSHVNVAISMHPEKGGQDGICGNFNGLGADDSLEMVGARVNLNVAAEDSLFTGVTFE